jgi:hypothetical protein
MRFELEGEPETGHPRRRSVLGARRRRNPDRNNRTDIRSRFLVTMLCVPGKPMLTLVDEDELAQRKDYRAPRPT